ncbi:MAG TPA: family 20 glycosylhydrolase [Firmicutes bacterium]|nr:family 20 glycosylhydrolase [Bacillota bacterium]HHY98539.1 family 20 glycosylhydrolase [Bacillota bacterium]
MEEILLAPFPRKIQRLEGTADLSPVTFILIPYEISKEMLFIANRLKCALSEYTNVTGKIVINDYGAANGPRIRLVLDPEISCGKTGSYRLAIKPEEIAIISNLPEGIFYGVATLKQLLMQFKATLPCLDISDEPDFPNRGVMLDISRGKVPKMDTLFALVDWFADLKINQIQLYTEHTFEYLRHPIPWRGASPFTGEEILALDAFCKERFIELVPNQNSFAHLTPWLKHPEYIHMAECPEGFDTPWGGRHDEPFSLSPAVPDSLEFLDSLYDEFLPYFSSKQFNVGCDETFELGQGRSKALVESKGKHRVYFDFLMKIHELVVKHNRIMMFWGDIIMEAPELIPELPKDVIALEWGYEAGHPFDAHGEKFAKSGLPFYVCPGTSAWNTIGGRTENALGNLRNAAENGKKHGAMGYLNTDWGDNGHINYQPVSYLGFLYGAAVSWNYENNKDLDVAKALSRFAFQDDTGLSGKAFYDLGNVYKAVGLTTANASVLARILMEDLDKTRFVEGIEPEGFDAAVAAIRSAVDTFRNSQPLCKDADIIRREFYNAARLLLHACKLGKIKLHLSSEHGGPTPEVRRKMRELSLDLAEIIDEHRELWLARNRVGGLEDVSLRNLNKLYAAYRKLS